MPQNVDDLLEEIRTLSEAIAQLEDAHPKLARLTAERDKLRADARAISAASRHPLSVETEIDMLAARRDEINDMLVGEGYAEKRGIKAFADPSAFKLNINKLIREDHAQELEDITARLRELRAITPRSSD